MQPSALPGSLQSEIRHFFFVGALPTPGRHWESSFAFCSRTFCPIRLFPRFLSYSPIVLNAESVTRAAGIERARSFPIASRSPRRALLLEVASVETARFPAYFPRGSRVFLARFPRISRRFRRGGKSSGLGYCFSLGIRYRVRSNLESNSQTNQHRMMDLRMDRRADDDDRFAGNGSSSYKVGLTLQHLTILAEIIKCLIKKFSSK